MNIYNFFLRSTALMAAVATLACCGKQTKEAFPVPEKPILEMDYSAEKTSSRCGRLRPRRLLYVFTMATRW